MKLHIFSNGSVTFIPEIEAQEEARDVTKTDFGSVTNITSETQGRPARFDVSFMIQFSHGEPELEVVNTFHLETAVPAASRNVGYSEVETEAAQRMPSLLRELADALERQMADE